MSVETTGNGGPLARLRAAAPILIAAALFALGLYALWRLLADVDLRDVAAQLRATPWSTMSIAMAATLAGYLCLAGYDWSALRYIGKPLPLPITLTGGLMAYAFGNTVGLSAVSGGAVRYRVYAGLGLDGYDVAAVSSFAAMSFGVAATVVGLGALALHPGALGALSPLPPEPLRWAAIAGVLAIVGPLSLAAVRRGALRVGRFTIRAPSLPVLGGQILFSLGDICFSALTLYVLLPHTGVDFATFLAIFAAATMAGILSHVPGGVGVFETVVLAALPAGTPIDQAAAGLLLYRVTYYIAPFALALTTLALWEVASAVAPGAKPRLGGLGRTLARVAPALRAAGSVTPLALAAAIFGSGLWLSLAPLIPPTSVTAEALEEVLPLVFLESGALLSSALGAGLIVLALGVARRSLGAYWLSLAGMAAGIVAALADGLDWDRALTLAAVILLVAPFRREFHRRTSLVHGAFSPQWFLLVGGLVASVAFLLFFAHKGTPYAHELWWQFAVDERAPRALRAGLVGALLASAAALALLLRTPRLRPEGPSEDAVARAAAIVARQSDPWAALALTGDKALLFSDDGAAFVAFAAHGGSWIALGGPVGPEDSAREAAWTFADAARRAGERPVFYEVGPEHKSLMLDLGLKLSKLGEEAIVDLAGFSLEGASRKKLRAAHARAGRDGLCFAFAHPPHAAELMSELRVVSDAWLADRRGREKGFSVGRFEEGWVQRWPVAMVRRGERLEAFASVLTTEGRAEATVDLMRRRADCPAVAMEFLFTSLMLRLSADGCGRFSLGMAPLAGLEAKPGADAWSRFGALVFRHGGRFYNFAGLRGFKQKFDPTWRPRFLAAPTEGPPLAALADAALLIGGRDPGIAGDRKAPDVTVQTTARR